jgi:hypothetical protein
VAAALDRLAREIAELRRTVERPQRARGEGEQGEAPARTSLEPAPPRARAELSDLIETLQRVCARQAGGESLAQAAAHAPARPADLFDRLAQSDEERTRRFRLGGYREVLSACGVPDTVVASPQGELLWCYDEPGSERKLWFAFVDGLVVRVFG